jgi:hypothetical protein
LGQSSSCVATITAVAKRLPALAMGWLLFPAISHAQAGPPLITNDPDTPGPGAWEINVAATGAHAGGAWDIDAPDVDINHGVGERVQLSLHVPWSHRDAAGAWTSGIGAAEFAVRWRFLDQSRAGIAVAVQPMWIASFSRAAERRGLASANAEFVLPLQAARSFDRWAAGMEIARHFVANEPDAWQAGVFAEYDCAATVQCLAEINTRWSDGANTLLDVGARKALSPHLNLLGSIGRQVTGHAEDRTALVFYLGAQFLY